MNDVEERKTLLRNSRCPDLVSLLCAMDNLSVPDMELCPDEFNCLLKVGLEF